MGTNIDEQLEHFWKMGFIETAYLFSSGHKIEMSFLVDLFEIACVTYRR